MIDLIFEALDVPPAGSPGRRRFIARQLWRLTVEGLVFLLALAAIFACLVLVAASTDSLPH